MPIKEHPAIGTILRCDFDQGFREPEMVKLRPVVVISPKISARPELCTVVALSTSEPEKVMPYHAKIDIPGLPKPYAQNEIWVKGDMICAVGFHRLDFLTHGKDRLGNRIYHYTPLSDDKIKIIRTCVLHGIGMSILTKHL